MELKQPVELTQEAKIALKQLSKKPGLPQGYLVRLAAQGGMACGGGGIQYAIGFDEEKEQDQLYEYEDLRVVIDRRQLMHLIGMKVHYEEREDEQGFVFLQQ